MRMVGLFESFRYMLRNPDGMEIKVISYGATLTSLRVPDKNGKIDDIILGFDDIRGKTIYTLHPAGKNVLKIDQETIPIHVYLLKQVPNPVELTSTVIVKIEECLSVLVIKDT